MGLVHCPLLENPSSGERQMTEQQPGGRKFCCEKVTAIQVCLCSSLGKLGVSDNSWSNILEETVMSLVKEQTQEREELKVSHVTRSRGRISRGTLLE